MDYHHHARLTVHGRELLCRAVMEDRLRLSEAAVTHSLSRQSAAKWVRRYREQGVDGIMDRNSRPRRLRQPLSPERVALVETLRRERWTGAPLALREWAYAQAFQNSEQREQHLAPWIYQYNWHRPHASPRLSPPISRSARCTARASTPLN